MNKKTMDSISVPGEVLGNPFEMNLYEKAIQGGIEYDRTIRINVVGNFGQGKTTLIRRLLDQSIYRVESTNGIDVQQHTCFRSADGKLSYKQDKEAQMKGKQAKKQEDISLQFWDFGGQFISYATHALFYSRQAIYPLVFDMSLPFNQFVIEEDCPIEVGNRCVDYYLRFWMKSIHSFVGTEDGKEPVVLLVGTHKDKIPGQPSEREKYIKKYFLDVRELFDDTQIVNHIYKVDFSIDNNDANDPGLFALREAILKIGEERSRSIAIPAKWIQLEKALDVIKYLKLVTLQTVLDIDDSTEFPIQDREQIKLFLRYNHSKGALVFFDESPLSDYVILDSQILIDAFKRIITSERFYNNDPEIRPMRRLLHTEARLEDSLIEYQWKTEKMFIENKNILLGFLEKHRIITQAREYDEANRNLQV